MTKSEAIEAMKRGEKVTHTYFCSSEWMTMRGCMIELEDGIACTERDFWSDRTDQGWESGYSIWEGGDS
jgi:hypothetical protein